MFCGHLRCTSTVLLFSVLCRSVVFVVALNDVEEGTLDIYYSSPYSYAPRNDTVIASLPSSESIVLHPPK